MADISSINPFSNIDVWSSLGTFGSIALVITIAVVILGLIAGLIYWRIIKKAYWINIECSRLIGGIPQRVGTYTAREVPFGMAGDKLWRVSGAGMWKIKTTKWLPVGKLQSAPRLWKYWIREDGEWINYIDSNIDAVSKTMGVRFVNEDMRLQRLATERLLEQRLLDKSFWEKWQTVIMTVILFLVVAICMVIIFYQWSKLIEKMIPLVQMLTEALAKSNGYNNATGGISGLVPV